MFRIHLLKDMMKSIILASVAVAANAAKSIIVEIPHLQPNGAVVGLNTTFHFSSSINSTINSTFAFNGDACDDLKPLTILLNGAPIIAAQYADVAKKMADQGYVVAIPEYSERSGIIDDPTCIVQNPPFPAASTANSVDDYLTATKPDFLTCTDTDKIILLGHSAGGAAAFFAADGSCDTFFSRFIPQCEGFTDMLDSNGVNKLKGVLVFEGTAGESDLPPGVFAGIVSSTYGDRGDGYVSAYNDINADKKVLLTYNDMNHYSVNNWNEGEDPPCGSQRSGDEANFVEDEANHEEGTSLIADAFINIANAFMYDDSQAVEFLETGAKENPRLSLIMTQGVIPTR